MSRSKQIEAQDEYLGKEQTLTIGEIAGDQEIIDRPMTMDKAQKEAFMREPVTIMIHEGSSEADIDLVQVAVNGVNQFIRRGVPQTVKRMYVERLARAKPTDYQQNLDDRLGEAMNRLQQRHALKYPFVVIEDRNPRGGAWLKAVLAQRQ